MARVSRIWIAKTDQQNKVDPDRKQNPGHMPSARPALTTHSALVLPCREGAGRPGGRLNPTPYTLSRSAPVLPCREGAGRPGERLGLGRHGGQNVVGDPVILLRVEPEQTHEAGALQDEEGRHGVQGGLRIGDAADLRGGVWRQCHAFREPVGKGGSRRVQRLRVAMCGTTSRGLLYMCRWQKAAHP